MHRASDMVPCELILNDATLMTSMLADYINRDTADKLRAAGVKPIGPQTRVCSALNDMCEISEGKYPLQLNFINERTNSMEIIHTKASCINTEFPIIIGRPTIKRNNLTAKLPSQFMATTTKLQCCTVERPAEPQFVPGQDDSTPESAPPATAATSQCKKDEFVWQHLLDAQHEHLATIFHANTRTVVSEHEQYQNRFPWETLCATTMKEILGAENARLSMEGDLPRHMKQYVEFDTLINAPTNEEADVLPKDIQGPSTLQTKIQTLLHEYKDIFSRSVRKEPAKLDPFVIELITNEQWKNSTKNSGRSRPCSTTKQDEMRKQVTKLQELGVITQSQSPHYSQVHMVPKKPTGWRFALDYRHLNLSTKSLGWPLPNIREIFSRIGDHRAKFYGVMDLTSGYHQCEVHPACRFLTAFITLFGLFEWVRVPMGLKGAPSYFQQMMAGVVLVGLLYACCEVYLDDILVFGKDEHEFVTNLAKVFARFRQYNITLHPDKCRFGLSEVEYVGYVINEGGMSFSKEKKDSILHFPKPVIMKQLKSFLGLANYFHTHVRDHSMLVRPLHAMLHDYNKTKKLTWTQSASEAFEHIKMAIHNCQTLTFLQQGSEVHLKTDASDYGIGAYLSQIIDGVERPVYFISKSLVKEQLNWSVPEKECFAIWYALKKLDYLLRDIHFTLHTDHRNLTFSNQSGFRQSDTLEIRHTRV
jgi:hypothetical protein